MLRAWYWIRGLRSRLRPGIEGWVNRWWAGGSNSSVSGARPPNRGALIHARWKLRSLLCGGGCASWRRRTSFGKSQRLLRVSAPKHQRFELMDAQKASSSVALMAKVLGGTRAGYYAWKTKRPTGVSARWCAGVWMRRWPGNTRWRAVRIGLSYPVRSGARGCGCGCAGGRRVDAPPRPHRPKHAPAPGKARLTGSSGP